MLNLCLFFGGRSVEHDVSIITYFQVLNAIDRKKYNLIPIYLSKENKFLRNDKLIQKIETFKKGDFKKFKEVNFIKKNNYCYLGSKKIDCVVVLVHGKDLEDGTVSGFLNILNVPYTNSSVISSAMFHSKYLTKLVLNNHKIKTLEYLHLTESLYLSSKKEVLSKIEKLKSVIVKPVSLGSSIGVFSCSKKEEFEEKIPSAFKYEREVIIEKKLNKFTEFNQAIYKNKNELIISKIEEVKNDSNFYSFESKYENSAVTRVIPARINSSLRNKIAKTTKKIGYMLNSKGVIRVDYLYEEDGDNLYVNEVNVIPGALGYYLFEANEHFFTDLLDNLISEAIFEYNKNKELINKFDSNLLNYKSNKK